MTVITQVEILRKVIQFFYVYRQYVRNSRRKRSQTLSKGIKILFTQQPYYLTHAAAALRLVYVNFRLALSEETIWI